MNSAVWNAVLNMLMFRGTGAAGFGIHTVSAPDRSRPTPGCTKISKCFFPIQNFIEHNCPSECDHVVQRVANCCAAFWKKKKKAVKDIIWHLTKNSMSRLITHNIIQGVEERLTENWWRISQLCLSVFVCFFCFLKPSADGRIYCYCLLLPT